MMKMYWMFYKSLLLMNIVFSLGQSLAQISYQFATQLDDAPFPFFTMFLQSTILFFMTTGFVLSAGYHEFYKKKRYVFFHNYSITKVKLFVSALLFNLVIGIFLLTIVFYA